MKAHIILIILAVLTIPITMFIFNRPHDSSQKSSCSSKTTAEPTTKNTTKNSS